MLKSKEMKGWIWKEKNIEDNLIVMPFARRTQYRWNCFSKSKEQFFSNGLYEEVNFQLKTETPLNSVLQLIAFQVGDKAAYLPSAEYGLLD